jgi:hypothetical protein
MYGWDHVSVVCMDLRAENPILHLGGERRPLWVPVVCTTQSGFQQVQETGVQQPRHQPKMPQAKAEGVQLCAE